MRFEVRNTCPSSPLSPRKIVADKNPELFPFKLVVIRESSGVCQNCGKKTYRISEPSRIRVERNFGLPDDGPRHVCGSMGVPVP